MEPREDDVIGGCARGELRQHVSLATAGDRDTCRAGHRQIARDLERADRAAGDEDAQTAKAVGIRVLRGVRDAAHAGE